MQHKEIMRKRLLEAVATRVAESPVTVLLGARQVGKTTLAKMFCGRRYDVTWFDLETVKGFESLQAMPEKTLAEKHGQVVNLAELGRTMGVAPGAARQYLDILCGAHVLRQLPPWYENLGECGMSRRRTAQSSSGKRSGAARSSSRSDDRD